MSDNKETKNVILDEQEEKLLLGHNYDGIEEFNHPLPSWWSLTFVGGVIFAIIYLFYYEVFGGLSLKGEYERDMKKFNIVKAEQQKKLNGFDVPTWKSWIKTNDGIKKGSEVFEENCVSCHLEGGLGDIGPNLTDNFWINIKEVNPTNLYNFIRTGNEDAGMPAWGELLEKEELYAAVAHVLTLHNTNKKGKDPQGEKVTPATENFLE